MPMPPLDPEAGSINNILDRLIFLLKQDEDFTACIDQGEILSYDVRGRTPQGRQAPPVLPVCCLVPAAFDLEARTIGGRGGGDHTHINAHALLLYRANGQGADIAASTTAMRKAAWWGAMAVLKCRPDPDEDGADPPYVPQWNDLSFRSPAGIFEELEPFHRCRLVFDIWNHKVINP